MSTILSILPKTQPTLRNLIKPNLRSLSPNTCGTVHHFIQHSKVQKVRLGCVYEVDPKVKVIIGNKNSVTHMQQKAHAH